MAILTQKITNQYAAYNGDCMEVMPKLPDGSMHFSVYSPPFAGLYQYSSNERDLSNVRSYSEFMDHYGYVVDEIRRLTMPGRITAVHCMDVPTGNSGHNDALLDFPGDIIRLHQKLGFEFVARRFIWKEPLWVRNRTLVKGLAHRTVVDDATQSSVASSDYLLAFRRRGDNPIPVAHPTGFDEYAGESSPPADVLRFRGYTGNQIQNRYSHWIWRQYASSVWDDIRMGNVLPFEESRDEEDERHVHPLQLDVITRALHLYSNPGERVLTPFLGVGSEAYEAARQGRIGVGVELKPSYYRQAIKNLDSLADRASDDVEMTLFD